MQVIIFNIRTILDFQIKVKIMFPVNQSYK